MMIYIGQRGFPVRIEFLHDTGKFSLVHQTPDNIILKSEEHYVLNDLFSKMAVVLRKHYNV